MPSLDSRYVTCNSFLDGRTSFCCRPLWPRAQGITNPDSAAENAAEAAVMEGVSIYGVHYLAEVVALLERPGHVGAAEIRVNPIHHDRMRGGIHPRFPDEVIKGILRRQLERKAIP